MDGFGFRGRDAALVAAGGLLQHLHETQKSGLEHIDRLLAHEPSRQLLLDAATRRNLEIERNQRDGGRHGTLLEALDTTLTAAGGRLLRSWLLAPLVDPQPIGERLDAVAELRERSDLRQRLRHELDQVRDVERLLARVVAATANARDLLGIQGSLARVPAVIEALEPAHAGLLTTVREGTDPCGDVIEKIVRAIADDPPATLRDGGVIRDGYDPELDELRAARRDGRAYIASLEARERQATGIASLKVRFHKVFGYTVEVSKANLHLVPAHYQRRQTIAGGERFVTPELKEHEARVLQAQERIEGLELELFAELRAALAIEAPRVRAAARALAQVDVLAALAESAARWGYQRPRVDAGRALRVVRGRHPVVEQNLGTLRFIPNETAVESGAQAIAILTGPNMGGKSTYLRQVALIALLAQAGSFVPADEADIGIVDRIFCRVGASDSLAEGQSTFMVEMAETANILHHATSQSLVVLDEVGRGTSTFDGLSIAWAVVEHLAAMPGGAPRTLFATHYHELTELAAELDAVTNLRMAVQDETDGIVFLHRVERGASDRSYGLHVARLAGVPPSVIDRAQEILANIERDEYGGDGLPRRARGRRPLKRAARAEQGALFPEQA
jgi:DNA mismatch repair protein MutS